MLSNQKITRCQIQFNHACLDILPEFVHTIEDGLHFFSSPKSLEGYRILVGKAGFVSARKDLKLRTLPKLLILHLMCFSFGITRNGKIHKPIHFSLEIILGCNLLVSPTIKGLRYELVATITHHGRDTFIFQWELYN